MKKGALERARETLGEARVAYQDLTAGPGASLEALTEARLAYQDAKRAVGRLELEPQEPPDNDLSD